MGGTRKFYDTQVYNPADDALGHLDVSFTDCPTTGPIKSLQTWDRWLDHWMTLMAGPLGSQGMLSRLHCLASSGCKRLRVQGCRPPGSVGVLAWAGHGLMQGLMQPQLPSLAEHGAVRRASEYRDHRCDGAWAGIRSFLGAQPLATLVLRSCRVTSSRSFHGVSAPANDCQEGLLCTEPNLLPKRPHSYCASPHAPHPLQLQPLTPRARRPSHR